MPGAVAGRGEADRCHGPKAGDRGWILGAAPHNPHDTPFWDLA